MRRLFTLVAIGLLSFTPTRLFDNTAQALPFTQNWTTTTLITANDNWSGVPGIEGYLGQNLTTATGVDPQTVLGVSVVGGDLTVLANQAAATSTAGDVGEFDGLANPTIGLQGSGTADAPYIVINLNTSGLQTINVAYNLRDIDGSADDAIQAVALQYRVGNTGNFTNVPAGFVADATTGGTATQVTPVSAALPAACDNQALVQVRIITTNAVGNDEWVGIDDINITGTPGTFNSANSDIIYNTGFTAPANINYLLYQAVNITNANSIEVGQFTIRDGGAAADADAVGTTLTDLVMSLSNAANIRRVAIYDGTTEIAEVAGGASVSFSALGLVAADDASKTYSVRVTFNTAVTDNQQFVFAVTSATADAAGSTFAAGNAGGAATSSAGDDNRIEVTADRLAYIQNTTSPTGINTAMTPAVSLSANDINANRDLDFVEQVRITSTGTLAGSPVDVAAVAGVVSFTTLTHTALGTGLNLNAERTNTLDWDVVSNPFDIIVASSASDYFRSQATGNWNVAATWESSPDNATWQPATLVPDFNANTIYIRNTHVVTANTAITVDQVDVQSGGTLVNQMPLNTGITFANGGAGDDMVIRAGGIYQVIPVDDYADYNILQAGATIHIENSGVISIGNGGALGGGSNHNSFASTSGSYIWDNGAIFDWNTLGFPGTSGVTYFPDAAAGVIPIWRFTVAPTAGFGGGSPLVVNGVLEANDDVVFNGNSNKTFRNGITGTGNVTQAVSTGRMIINGATAVLGGTGIIFPNANNLEIGTGTIVTMTSAKAITGGVVLLSNSYIELGNFNLSVNGTIAGGTTNYVRTNGTGSLVLVNVTSLKSAPIGNSTYNPLTINNASGHNWNLRVEDALTVADPTFLPNIIGAVQREWHITPSTNPPATGADIVFQWDDSDPAQVGASYDELQNVQVWHEVPSGMPWGSDWIAAGVAQTATGAPGPGIRTASITGWTWFSPFAVSNINFPLPLKLITFNAVKINSSMANLSWELAGVALPGASFEVEKSADGRSFTSFSALPASTTNRFYFLNDTRLGKGVTYYRLKMIDADGKITYGKVVAVINDKTGIYITNIAPNPLTDRSTLTLSAAKAGTVTFEVYSLSGVVVKRWNAAVAEGTNIITMQAGELPAGIYQLVATGQEARAVTRFVKQ